jgi:hypothetical protein
MGKAIELFIGILLQKPSEILKYAIQVIRLVCLIILSDIFFKRFVYEYNITLKPIDFINFVLSGDILKILIIYLGVYIIFDIILMYIIQILEYLIYENRQLKRFRKLREAMRNQPEDKRKKLVDDNIFKLYLNVRDSYDLEIKNRLFQHLANNRTNILDTTLHITSQVYILSLFLLGFHLNLCIFYIVIFTIIITFKAIQHNASQLIRLLASFKQENK